LNANYAKLISPCIISEILVRQEMACTLGISSYLCKLHLTLLGTTQHLGVHRLDAEVLYIQPVKRF